MTTRLKTTGTRHSYPHEPSVLRAWPKRLGIVVGVLGVVAALLVVRSSRPSLVEALGSPNPLDPAAALDERVVTLDMAGLPSVEVGCNDPGEVCDDSVQAAIDGLGEGEWVVRIGPGIYHQNLKVFRRRVHLVAVPGTVWFDGEGVEPVPDSDTYGVVIDQSPGSSLDGIAVRNYSRLSADGFRSAIRIDTSDDTALRDVTVVDNSFAGLGVFVSDRVAVERATVRRNDVIGVNSWLCDDLSITDSVVADNTDTAEYQAPEEQYRESAGIKLTESRRATIVANRVEHNGSTGIWLDLDSSNSNIVGNEVIDNLWYGIEVEISDDVSVRANRVVANADRTSPFPNPRHGVVVLDSRNTALVDNFIDHRLGDMSADDSQALRIAETAERPTHPRLGEISLVTSGVRLTGNTIYERSPRGIAMAFFDAKHLHGMSEMVAASDGNTFGLASGASLASDAVRGSQFVTIRGSSALAQWRALGCATACRDSSSVVETIE